MERAIIRIGNVADIGRGSSPRPIIDKKYFQDGEIPWIKIADATASGKYIYKTKEYVNDVGAAHSRKMKPGTLILSASGSLGIPHFLGVEGCIHDGWIYMDNIHDIDKQYLYYLLLTMRPYFNNLSYGAAIQNINTSILSKTKIEVPDMQSQEKIGLMLSTYDNLIENNNKRIKLLEQMAENLYKEWFVRFRFPGYEDMGFENGIPMGWKIKRIKDFGQVITGKTPSTEISSNYGDRYLFIKTPDMHDNMYVIDSSEKLSERGNDVQKLKKIPRWSIMVSCIGTGGVVSINSKEAHTNQQINSIVLHDENNIEWLFFVCKSLKTTIEMFGATGSTMTNLSKGKFENLKILEPNLELIDKYHMYTYDIFKEVEKLMYSNKNLIKQRDMLLPRLMSGRLEV